MPESPERNGNAGNDDSYQYPKWWNPKRWGIVGAVVFIIAVIALFIATRFYVGHPNDTPAFVAGVIGLLTLYAILLQIFVSKMQWQAMQQGLKQNREFFMASERPAVGITKLTWEILENGDAQASIVITNTGKTPARKLLFNHRETMWAARSLKTNPDPEPVHELKKPDRPTVLQVGGVATRISIFNNVEDIMTAKYTIFIWVYITYEDLSGNSYFFEGYFEFVPLTSAFRACTTHNDAN